MNHVKLTSIHNFRDVAGHGYRLTPAGQMARGLVYRSTALTVAPDDQRLLEELGIATVVDLRTGVEIAKQPDVTLAGAHYLSVDVLSGNSSVVAPSGMSEVSVEEARREMVRTYESFVLGDAERAGFAQAVQAVASSTGPSIIHCTAGKDRTGWTSAVLQLVAGVGQDDVIADYMLTREQSAGFVTTIRAYLEAEMPERMAVVDVLLDVDEDYLRGSLDALSREFGDVRRYLTEGGGLAESLVDDLSVRLRGI